MSFDRFIPQLLKADEIEYELRIRSCRTVRDLEHCYKILDRALSVSPCNDTKLVDPLCTFNDEQGQINRTIASIQSAVDDLDQVQENDPAVAKIKSRLAHITIRLERVVAKAGDDAKVVSDFKNETKATIWLLESDLFSTKIISPSLIKQPRASTVPSNFSSGSSVPVYKWGVTFDGKPNNLNSFLERVEELAFARNVNRNELFNSAIDLFTGSALTWFRAVRDSVHDWDNLVFLLRNEFLPTDYDDRMWVEIKARSQGKKESVSLYIGVMEALFKRLSKPPTEMERLKIIKNNLLPHFQTHLALMEILTIQTLKDTCRKIEDAIEVQNKYSPPPKHSELIEKNLAYIDGASTSSGCSYKNSRTEVNILNSKRGPIICFNCKQANHVFKECTAKRNKFCFKCGEPEVTVRTCKKCSKN